MPELDALPNWSARVAGALALWPERAAAAQSELAATDHAMRRRLARRLEIAYPRVAREDIAAAIDNFLGAHGRQSITFLDWIGCLSRALGLSPQSLAGDAWSPARAVINAASWRSWLAASARYDLTCLLTYSLAVERNMSACDYDSCSWGVVCDLWSDDLDAILRRGVSDMHVHLNGHRYASVVWLRSIAMGLQRDELPGFHARLDAGSAETRSLLHRFIGGSVEPPATLGALLVAQVRDLLEADAEPQLLLDAERRLLIDAWRAAASDPKQSGALDQYFNAKSTFLSIVTQPASGVRPGLGEFRDYFAATRFARPRARRLAFERRDLMSVLTIAATDQRLRRLELRMAPLPSKGAYEVLLATFEDLSCGIARSIRSEHNVPRSSPLETRLCVHFMRSHTHFREPNEAWRQSWRRFHIDLAYQAATFHAYRSALQTLGESGRRRLACIPRIDVAGQERDTPPAFFAFVVRLLRCEPQSWRSLVDGVANCEIYAPWRSLANNAGASTLPRLSASCHAGEDYFHPLDGLAAMDAAIEGLLLANGDSIGHGLALGAVAENGATLRGEQCFAPAGRQFDVLLWLHHLAQRSDAPKDELHRLDDGLCDIAAKLQITRPVNGWTTLHGLLEAQLGPVLGVPRNGNEGMELFYRQCEDEAFVEARMAQHEILPVFNAIPRLAQLARNAVGRKIAERGVLIEVNPSSNLRVSGASEAVLDQAHGDMRRWPLINLVRDWRTEIRFTINTDDPGVFDTSVASEFALLFQCLLEDKWSRSEAVAFLETCRLAGLEALR